VCPGTKEIAIFATNGKEKEISKWTLVQVLKFHYAQISALSWHPETDLLLSCSADRAAIVWKANEDGKREPRMVIVKEKKSNLDAQWNRYGDKFVIGSSSGFVYQCTYNEQQKFWVAE